MLYDWTRGYEYREFKRIKIGGESRWNFGLPSIIPRELIFQSR